MLLADFKIMLGRSGKVTLVYGSALVSEINPKITSVKAQKLRYGQSLFGVRQEPVGTHQEKN
jgi:hypothetical protein